MVLAVCWIRRIVIFLLIRDGRELDFIVFEEGLEDSWNVFVFERVLVLEPLVRILLLFPGLLL